MILRLCLLIEGAGPPPQWYLLVRSQLQYPQRLPVRYQMQAWGNRDCPLPQQYIL